MTISRVWTSRSGPSPVRWTSDPSGALKTSVFPLGLLTKPECSAGFEPVFLYALSVVNFGFELPVPVVFELPVPVALDPLVSACRCSFLSALFESGLDPPVPPEAFDPPALLWRSNLRSALFGLLVPVPPAAFDPPPVLWDVSLFLTLGGFGVAAD